MHSAPLKQFAQLSNFQGNHISSIITFQEIKARIFASALPAKAPASSSSAKRTPAASNKRTPPESGKRTPRDVKHTSPAGKRTASSVHRKDSESGDVPRTSTKTEPDDMPSQQSAVPVYPMCKVSCTLCRSHLTQMERSLKELECVKHINNSYSNSRPDYHATMAREQELVAILASAELALEHAHLPGNRREELKQQGVALKDASYSLRDPFLVERVRNHGKERLTMELAASDDEEEDGVESQYTFLPSDLLRRLAEPGTRLGLLPLLVQELELVRRWLPPPTQASKAPSIASKRVWRAGSASGLGRLYLALGACVHECLACDGPDSGLVWSNDRTLLAQHLAQHHAQAKALVAELTRAPRDLVSIVCAYFAAEPRRPADFDAKAKTRAREGRSPEGRRYSTTWDLLGPMRADAIVRSSLQPDAYAQYLLRHLANECWGLDVDFDIDRPPTEPEHAQDLRSRQKLFFVWLFKLQMRSACELATLRQWIEHTVPLVPATKHRGLSMTFCGIEDSGRARTQMQSRAPTQTPAVYIWLQFGTAGPPGFVLSRAEALEVLDATHAARVDCAHTSIRSQPNPLS